MIAGVVDRSLGIERRFAFVGDEWCEKRPASHAGNWKTDHAPVAKQRGDGCLVCHGGEKFCKECH